jgi:hypothetical protein
MSESGADVIKVSLETLDLAKKYVRHGLKLNSDKSIPDYEAETPLYELWRSASDPLTSPGELKKLLTSEDNDAIRMALYNPNLPVSDAASFLRDGFETDIEERAEIISHLSQEEFEAKFDFKKWDMDSDELDDFEAAIGIKLEENADPFERHYMFEEEADEFIFDLYIVIKHGSENQKKFVEKKHARLFEFIESLEKNHLIKPYLFWTLYGLDFNLNREYMQTEFDGQVLAGEESFDDPSAVAFLLYPEDFKPLEDVNEDWIYNIESGMFTVSNQILPAETTSKNSNSSKYEVLSGEGDGYYPTIPFFDSFGELQAVTTFFIDMSDAEFLDFCLEEDALFRSKVFESHIPAKLGYLKSKGSLFFGDSNGLSSDADSSYQIIEFANVPEGDYLVIAYIDVYKRPWAVSLLRDRAKRNYEILFEVFPELTKVLVD